MISSFAASSRFNDAIVSSDFAIMALIGTFISLCGVVLMFWKLSLAVYGISAMFFGVFVIVVGAIRDAIDRAIHIQRIKDEGTIYDGLIVGSHRLHMKEYNSHTDSNGHEYTSVNRFEVYVLTLLVKLYNSEDNDSKRVVDFYFVRNAKSAEIPCSVGKTIDVKVKDDNYLLPLLDSKKLRYYDLGYFSWAMNDECRFKKDVHCEDIISQDYLSDDPMFKRRFL